MVDLTERIFCEDIVRLVGLLGRLGPGSGNG